MQLSMTTADLLLQFEVTPGQFDCIEFLGVPSGRKGWICIAATGQRTLSLVAQLAGAIKADVLQAGAVEAREVPCYIHPSQFDPTADPDRCKVLFLIPSEDAPLHDEAWYGNWNSDRFLSHVMIAAKVSKYFEMFDEKLRGDDHKNHPLRAVNATFWKSRIDETVPEIFQRTEVTSSSSRVFISYRRTDTLELAFQLYDELDHKGFEVFLDRYSIPSGYNFQRRLNQELMDKSMVVLLESKNIQQSDWTRHEISFAIRNRLGLLTVPMPDIDANTYLSSSARRPLKATDFVSKKPDSAGMWGRLEDNPMRQLLDEIKRVHADSLFKRRERLRTELVSTLNAHGIGIQYSATGPFRLTVRAIDHMIGTTTRPPGVDDFHNLHFSCKLSFPPDAQGILVGPCATFEPDRARLLQWLETITGCQTFDEGKLSELAKWLLTGSRV
jgi:hypothetical protein